MGEQVRVRVGQRGTLVIPARIRERLGLKKDSCVLLLEEGDRLILQPVPSFTDALAGLTRGCFGTSPAEVEEWLDGERQDR